MSLSSLSQIAGCVLAAKLTENPNVSVALLEAGNAHFDDPVICECCTNPPSRLRTLTSHRTVEPMGWMKAVFNPEYDWAFRTKPQSKAQNTVSTPDGKPDPSFYWSR